LVGVPEPPRREEQSAPTPASEARAPGAAFKLPANPFSDLGPQDLASFVDCTLFEMDTGNDPMSGEAGRTAAILPALVPAIEAEPPSPSVSSASLPPATTHAPRLPASAPPAVEPGLPKGLRVPLWLVLTGCVGVGVIVGLTVRGRSTTPTPLANQAGPAPSVAAAPTPVAAQAAVPAPTPPVAAPTATAAAAPAAAPAPTPSAAPTATAEPGPSAPAKPAEAAAGDDHTAPSKSAVAAPVEPEAPADDEPSPRPTRAASAGAGACTASISTDPPGASVSWGIKTLGESPIQSAKVPCGSATLTFRRDRYETATQQVSVAAGKTASISQHLRRPPATLVVGSSPPHGEIKINGQKQGAAPQRISVPRYQTALIEISMPGYATWKKEVYVREHEMRIGMQLRPTGHAEAGKPSAEAGKPPSAGK
jgi:hypothetical protein